MRAPDGAPLDPEPVHHKSLLRKCLGRRGQKSGEGTLPISPPDPGWEWKPTSMNTSPKNEQREPESFGARVVAFFEALGVWLKGLGASVRGRGRRAWSRAFGRERSSSKRDAISLGLTSLAVRAHVAPEPAGLRHLRRMCRASHSGGGSDDAHSAAA